MPDTMNRTEWLAQLKAGDEVAVVYGGYRKDRAEIKAVDHATATQIVIGPRRFRRTDGRIRGGATMGPGVWISRPSDATDALDYATRIRLQSAIDRLVREPSTTLPQLRAALAALKEKPHA